MRDQFERFCVSALTAAALSAGTVFSYVTGFGLAVSTRQILLPILAAAAALSAIGLLRRHASLVSGLFLGVFALYVFWYRAAFAAGFLESASPLVDQYQKAFGLFPGTDPDALAGAGTAPDFFLACAGVLLTFFTVRVIMGRHRLFPLALTAAGLLVLPLLVVETQPSVWSVALVAGSFFILLVDREGLFHRGRGRDRTALFMVLPAAAIVLIAAAFVHPDTYERPPFVEPVQMRVERFFERHAPFRKDERTGSVRPVLPSAQETLGNQSWNEQLEEADLGTAGPRRDTETTVMEVRTETDGRLYLRGNSFAYYGENAWRAQAPYQDASRDSAEEETSPASWTTDAEADAQVLVQTERHSLIYYLPYLPTALPDDAEPEGDAYLENPGGTLSYEIPYADGNTGLFGGDEAYQAYVEDTYLEVPDATREALDDILEEIPAGENADETAEAVAEFVRNSAVYSTETAAPPEGVDFVSWFLHESETGYCVHFASAAAVLLRCMGVPARFVNGYVTDVEAGEWTVVSQKDAHSWVEYYVDGEGWKYLDPTPATEEAASVSSEETEETVSAGTESDTSDAAGTEASSEASALENEGSGAEQKGVQPFWRLLLVVLTALAGWNVLARVIRHILFTRGKSGTRALRCFHAMRLLRRLTGVPLPDAAEQIAEKARFSRRGVSRAECRKIQMLYQEMRRQLFSEGPVARRLFCRFLLAI